MVVLALHRRYQRSCNACGYRWLVTRRQVQFVPKPSRSAVRGRGMIGQYGRQSVESFSEDMSAQLDLAESFRTCIRCGIDDFSQRAVTKEHPPDPDASPAS